MDFLYKHLKAENTFPVSTSYFRIQDLPIGIETEIASYQFKVFKLKLFLKIETLFNNICFEETPDISLLYAILLF